MALQERLRNVARNLAGATGSALVELATGEEPFFKAEDEESQERTPGGSVEDDAKNAPVPTQPATDDPKSLFWDPFAIIEQLGYKEKASPITYATLKAIAWKTPIIQAIIQLRLTQMGSFCVPAKSRYDMGFRLKLKDSEKEPTKQDKIWMQQMSTMLMRTGLTDNPRGRTTFKDFVHKSMKDSLIYDQMTWEIIPNRKGQPVEWYAVDSATIRQADSASTSLNEDAREAVRYVQIYDGMIINEYTQEEMCFGVRNPSTDIRLFGYGTSELEMLIHVITSMLWSWEYNQNIFRQGSVQKGLINIVGAVSDVQMRSFRRHWYQMLSGVENQWRTPITNADKIEWHDMMNTNRDMEFSAWFDFLIKVACAIFLMDPSELNFKYGNTGQKSAMGDENNRDRITESRERGLSPLLTFMATNINQHIIWPINEAFELEFVGLNTATKDEQAELNGKLVKTTRMVDELRAEDDQPPLPDGKGQIILDPVFLQNAQMIDGVGEEEGGFGDGDDDTDFESLLSQGEEQKKDDEKETEKDKKAEKKQFAKDAEKEADKEGKALAKSYVVDFTL